jgi:hypothetical protein
MPGPEKIYPDTIASVHDDDSKTVQSVERALTIIEALAEYGVPVSLGELAEKVSLAEHIPIDFRILDMPRDGKTKNTHAHNMLDTARQRKFKDITVLADSSYSDTKNLLRIRKYNWFFVMNLKSNRQVRSNPDEKYQRIDKMMSDAAEGTGKTCFLKGFGRIKAVKILREKTGKHDYLATNNLILSSSDIRKANARRWKIEEFHRGEKQTIKIQACQFRGQRAQRNHILCGTLAFLAIEKHRLETGSSWHESKSRIIIDALRDYLRSPFIALPVNSLKPR